MVCIDNGDRPYEYAAIPVTVNSLVPWTGPTSGDTLVSIFGSNFVDMTSITVSFTNSRTSIVQGTFVSTTCIITRSPSSAEAALAVVEVALNGQQYTTSAKTFTYYGMNWICMIGP